MYDRWQPCFQALNLLYLCTGPLALHGGLGSPLFPCCISACILLRRRGVGFSDYTAYQDLGRSGVTPSTAACGFRCSKKLDELDNDWS
jgi:hypothetical protein